MKKLAVVLVVIVFAFMSCDMTGQRYVMDIPEAICGTWEGANQARIYIEPDDIIVGGVSYKELLNDPECTFFSDHGTSDAYSMSYIAAGVFFKMDFYLVDSDTLTVSGSIGSTSLTGSTYKRVK